MAGNKCSLRPLHVGLPFAFSTVARHSRCQAEDRQYAYHAHTGHIHPARAGLAGFLWSGSQNVSLAPNCMLRFVSEVLMVPWVAEPMEASGIPKLG